jgi:hypothetical protein
MPSVTHVREMDDKSIAQNCTISDPQKEAEASPVRKFKYRSRLACSPFAVLHSMGVSTLSGILIAATRKRAGEGS